MISIIFPVLTAKKGCITRLDAVGFDFKYNICAENEILCKAMLLKNLFISSSIHKREVYMLFAEKHFVEGTILDAEGAPKVRVRAK